MNCFSMSWTNNMRPQSTTHGHIEIIVHSIIFDRCLNWMVALAYSKSQPNEFSPGYWPTITWQSGKSVWWMKNFILCAEYLLFGLFDRCLETIPSARRKGLAKILVREQCRRFAERQQLDIIAYISDSNVISMQLFESIGFQRCNRCTWVQVRNQSTPWNYTIPWHFYFLLFKQ